MEPTHTAPLDLARVFSNQRSRTIRAWWRRFGILLLLALVAFVLWQCAALIELISLLGPMIVWIQEKLALVLIPLALIFILWLILRNLPVRKQSVQTDSNGMSIKQGRRGYSVPWGEIERFYIGGSTLGFLGIRFSKRQKLSIFSSSNPEIKLDSSLEQFPELVDIVRTNTLEPLYERAKANLRISRELTFGEAQIHEQRGLKIKGRWMPFNTIREARIRNGKLRIKLTRGSSPAVRTDEMFNLDVLLKILNDYAPFDTGK